MPPMVAYFDDLPVAPPHLDHAAVEQARLLRLARDHLATSEPSVDYGGLATGRASTVEAARQWVKRARAKGELIVVDYDNRTLIPLFQLDEVFDIDPAVAAATKSLHEAGMKPWPIWQWFTAINPWIDARPIDVVGSPQLGDALDGLLG